MTADDIVAIAAAAAARHAHHEAGHAVAAVYRGGWLESISLGYVDWAGDVAGDVAGETRHWTAPEHWPFATFAGPWAEARWETAGRPEEWPGEALEAAWCNNDGDWAAYQEFAAQPQAAAAEEGWAAQLEQLWPAIEAVAALLVAGEKVTHQQVADPPSRGRR